MQKASSEAFCFWADEKMFAGIFNADHDLSFNCSRIITISATRIRYRSANSPSEGNTRRISNGKSLFALRRLLCRVPSIVLLGRSDRNRTA
jgi:hypothetical protein